MTFETMLLGRIEPEPEAAARRRRTATIFVVAAIAHVCGLVALSVFERFAAPPVETMAQEIPVEVVSPAALDPPQPEPRKETQPPEETRPEQKPEAAAAQPQPGEARRPAGTIVERPQANDAEQEARKRGARDADPDRKEANPFGALSATAPEEQKTARLPSFIAPQETLYQRPKPAADPTNDNYRAKVLGKVAESMLEPERPRPKALAIVGFAVDDRGALTSVWLVRPSGHPDLDAEAVEMVKRAAPFEPPPAKADRNYAAAIAFGGE